MVSSGATVNATSITSFTATSELATQVLLVNLTASNMKQLLTCPVQSGASTITGGAGTDIITGGSADDTIVIAISAEGNADTVNGGAGSDTHYSYLQGFIRLLQTINY